MKRLYTNRVQKKSRHLSSGIKNDVVLSKLAYKSLVEKGKIKLEKLVKEFNKNGTPVQSHVISDETAEIQTAQYFNKLNREQRKKDRERFRKQHPECFAAPEK